MKKILILLTSAVLIISCKTKKEVVAKDTFVINDVAKVKTINGAEVYIMNSPLRQYEIIKEIETTAKFENILKDGKLAKNTTEKVIQFVSLARKSELAFDAVLYTSGKTLVCIKFKEKGTPETIGMARVEKISGLHAFVLCEPSQAYDVIGETDEGLKMRSILSLGMASNSIAEDIDKMVEALKFNKGIEACLFYQSKGEAIKFKR